MRSSAPLLLVPAALALSLHFVNVGGDPRDRDGARAMSQAFQDVASQVTPAILQIRTYEERERGGRSLLARGSGVLVDPGGIAVTNSHVVLGSDRVVARLSDGREVEVDVRGVDPESDLAVLQLPGGGYPALEFAPSEPEVGTWVFAIGNPRGLGVSISFGIVSGQQRQGLGIAVFERFIQTDAAINAGNSGGPLVDLDGRVVGINTAKGQSGDLGIGFAIPSTMVRDVVAAIVEGGRVQRGWLGIEMETIDARSARRDGLPARRHVSVRDVRPGTPAELAGLLVGDVILALDGVEPTSEREVLERIASYSPGSLVVIDVWRGGERQRFEISLGERGARTAER